MKIQKLSVTLEPWVFQGTPTTGLNQVKVTVLVDGQEHTYNAYQTTDDFMPGFDFLLDLARREIHAAIKNRRTFAAKQNEQ